MRDYDGKTAAQRVAERRARLIDAGRRVFGEHGYAGSSIRGVLRVAGLQDRYFGESFADLDSLLAAVFDQIVEEEVAASRVAVEAAVGTSARARAMIETIAAKLDANRADARIKLHEVLGAGPVTQRQRQRGLYKLAALVAELLPPSPPDSGIDRLTLGLGVVASANELLIAWLADERSMARETVVETVTLIFHSLADRLASSSTHDVEVEPVDL